MKASPFPSDMLVQSLATAIVDDFSVTSDQLSGTSARYISLVYLIILPCPLMSCNSVSVFFIRNDHHLHTTNHLQSNELGNIGNERKGRARGLLSDRATIYFSAFTLPPNQTHGLFLPVRNVGHTQRIYGGLLSLGLVFFMADTCITPILLGIGTGVRELHRLGLQSASIYDLRLPFHGRTLLSESSPDALAFFHNFTTSHYHTTISCLRKLE